MRFIANPIKFFFGDKPEKKQTTEKIFRRLLETCVLQPDNLLSKFEVIDTTARTTAVWKSRAAKAADGGRLSVLQRERDTAVNIKQALCHYSLQLVPNGPRVILTEDLFCETDEIVCRLTETGETFIFRVVNTLGSPTDARRTVFQAGWDVAIAFNQCVCPTLHNGIILIEQESPNSMYLLTGEFLSQDPYSSPCSVDDVRDHIRRLADTERVPKAATLQRF